MVLSLLMHFADASSTKAKKHPARRWLLERLVKCILASEDGGENDGVGAVGGGGGEAVRAASKEMARVHTRAEICMGMMSC